MPTKACKACKEQIDTSASKCPKCGTDQRGFVKKHPILIGLVGFFLFFVIIGAVFGDSATTSSQPQSSAKQEVTQQEENNTPSEQPEVKEETPAVPEVIEASVLIADYDANKLAADEKYKDKYVQTTAFIKNISSDIVGQYYLSLNPVSDEYYFGTSLQCYFKDKDELTSLTNGSEVTVKGTMDEMSIGSIMIKDCAVVKE